MPDYGFGYANKAQQDIERRLRRIYQDAQKELIKKLDEHTKRLNAMDKVKRQQLADGEITKKQYDKWLLAQMFTGKRWKDQISSLTDTLLHANERANDIVEGKRRAVFGDNYLYQAHRLADDIHAASAFSLYDSATVTRLLRDQPELLKRREIDKNKDRGWNQSNIANAVTQGIIQGSSVDEVAKLIAERITGRNESAMTRYARTAMTAAQNAGRIEMLREAQEMGIRVKKVWLAVLDDRTRDAHAELDGQERNVDEPFDSILGKIMYPGDPSADPANVWNCRCGLIYNYEKYEMESATRYDQENGEKIEYMTYREWKRRRK